MPCRVLAALDDAPTIDLDPGGLVMPRDKTPDGGDYRLFRVGGFEFLNANSVNTRTGAREGLRMQHAGSLGCERVADWRDLSAHC